MYLQKDLDFQGLICVCTFTRDHRHDDGGAGGGALDEDGEEYLDEEHALNQLYIN